ncbi:hypothetical protein [Aeromonas salmonicida]|uniref:hypothetical protein n=1 Tax=Aeromonas salmonicida TaxID=645 RepID=UPI000DB9B007|nr:hypothetical protein [Aeromonas salmonicida]MBS2780564.1 hypothetical protein [Aeromonas salmonicida]
MLYADGYALGFPPPAVVYASGVLNTWDVTNYVIKLQMQKQIPTLLQAFRKRLYEMKFGISVNTQLSPVLAIERLFKTWMGKSGRMGFISSAGEK